MNLILGHTTKQQQQQNTFEARMEHRFIKCTIFFLLS